MYEIIFTEKYDQIQPIVVTRLDIILIAALYSPISILDWEKLYNRGCTKYKNSKPI